MPTMTVDDVLQSESTLSIDDEIVRIAGMIAKSLAERIRASLRRELTEVLPALAEGDAEVTRAAETVAARLAHHGDTSPPSKLVESAQQLPPAAATAEQSPIAEEAQEAPTETIGEAWRAQLAAASPDISSRVLEGAEQVGNLYQLATEAVNEGYNPETAEYFLSMADGGGAVALNPEDAAARMALFRSAVAFEIRTRKQEDKDRRSEEATKRRLEKMAQKRQKVEAASQKRRLEIESKLSGGQKPAASVEEMQKIEIKPVDESVCRKLVVVGLLPAQSEMIGREFKGAFEFAFYGSDHIGRLTNMLPLADAVVMMTDFISHSHCELVGDLAKLIRVSGGMSSLRKSLRDYYQESYLAAEEH